ncbi:uncharacterized protein TNCV_378051 [Trichonephila clavipes]|nr:uncharacterized protein TNCV_378051 [Trichonephila clavipes]
MSTLLQNPKLNIVECVNDLVNLKKYLVFKRPDENLKSSVNSITTLGRDLGIDPKFPTSRLRKKVYLFVYESSDEPALNSFQQFVISSANRQFTLLSECYLIFCFLYEFHIISDDGLIKA